MSRWLPILMLMMAGCARVASEAQTAVALARTCSTSRGVAGSALELDHPTVHPRGGKRWFVSFPEQQAALPSGRDLVVDLSSGTCAHALMD